MSHDGENYIREQTFTSGPGHDTEGDVTLREEQHDAARHGTKCESIRPAVTEAADRIQRPGAQKQQNIQNTYTNLAEGSLSHI